MCCGSWGRKESDRTERLSLISPSLLIGHLGCLYFPKSIQYLAKVLIYCQDKFLFFYFNFLAIPHGMWNLRFLTRDGTWAPCGGSLES